jgi:hypothetical protein
MLAHWLYGESMVVKDFPCSWLPSSLGLHPWSWNCVLDSNVAISGTYLDRRKVMPNVGTLMLKQSECACRSIGSLGLSSYPCLKSCWAHSFLPCFVSNKVHTCWYVPFFWASGNWKQNFTHRRIFSTRNGATYEHTVEVCKPGILDV